MTDAQKKKMDDLDAVRLISDTLSEFSAEEQQRIMRWVQEKTNLVFQPQSLRSNTPAAAITEQAPNPPLNSQSRGADIRSFIAQKQPSSDNQFAACVAYYYQFEALGEERKDSINANDLQDATRKAGRNRLGDPAKTLANANAQGLLDKKSRGSYTLNTVGENLVAMTLPSKSSNEAKATKKKKPRKS